MTTTTGDSTHLLLPSARTSTRIKERAAVVLRQTALELFVSRDEEYVSCRLVHGDREVELQARTHNALLLILARARLEDARGTLPTSEQGWLYREDLTRMLKIDNHLLNVWIHRLRLQFEQVGVVDAARLIERRSSVRQVRLGPSRLMINRP